jgi:cysteine desulfurase/selenocysteine lyase
MDSGDAGIQDLCRQCDETAPFVTIGNVRRHIPGLERTVPVVGGGQVPYVNLDNAATTPPFDTVVDCLGRFFEWYSSVHRGTGFKSLLSTHVYERCREVVADFVGADLSYHTLIFGQNATHAINKLAQRICPGSGCTVITTLMEHHSNLLPWRKLGCEVVYARVNRTDGALDLADLRDKIERSLGRLRLVTVSGGSNVTGELPPIRAIARMVHDAGAMFAVDATQIVPHRAFRMGEKDDPERVDFAAFSAHKMYAPFGCGVLVGPRCVFEQGVPDMVGGGTVHAVTLEDTIWAELPERDEAGTPNVPGAIALATAVRTLNSIGMDELAEHERTLTRRALSALKGLDGLTVYGQGDPALERDRLGVITMNAPAFGHAKLAAALGYEHGIGVRNGCFCAQPYVRELLGVSDQQMQQVLRKLACGEHTDVPGMVRMSLGVYSTADEVDQFVEALRQVLTDGPSGHYVLDALHKDYVPETPTCDLSAYAPF